MLEIEVEEDKDTTECDLIFSQSPAQCCTCDCHKLVKNPVVTAINESSNDDDTLRIT